jgi:hypothetical protein
MLGDPNYSSPANVDASVEMRNNPERFLEKTKKLVDKANRYAPLSLRNRDQNVAPDSVVVLGCVGKSHLM